MDKYPAAFARFYDTVYARNRTVDIDFYAKKMRDPEMLSRGPVLEIGSGTGRLLKAAGAPENPNLFGLEPSPHIRKICIEKLGEGMRDRLFDGLVQKMDLGKKFALIVAPFRIMQHLLSLEEQKSALERIHEHLLPGGIFIWDAFIPNPEMMAKGKITLTDFEGEWKPGHALKRSVNVDPSVPEQVTKLWIHHHWQENGDWQHETFATALHHFYPSAIRLLIDQSPFTLEHLLGDFDGNPVGPKSQELIVICRS